MNKPLKKRMKAKTQRMWIIAMGGLCLLGAMAIILTIFKDNLVFFFSPTDIKNRFEEGRNISPKLKIKVGGLVKEGSIKEDRDSLKIEFDLTDNLNSVRIYYSGIKPPMFRAGQGIIAEGYLLNKSDFRAKRLLTKHDENYMPPEIAEALKKAGQWKGQ